MPNSKLSQFAAGSAITDTDHLVGYDVAAPGGNKKWTALQIKTYMALHLKAPLASPAFTGTVTGITKAMVGLGNVDNTADADKPVSTAQAAAFAARADLVSGKVPESQLPSYVDDVVEFNNLADFPTTGESGKIYITGDEGKTYRWTGSIYAEITSGGGLDATGVRAVTATGVDLTPPTVEPTEPTASNTILEWMGILWAWIQWLYILVTGLLPTAKMRIFYLEDYDIILDDPDEEANNTAKFSDMIVDIYAAKGGKVHARGVGICYGSMDFPARPWGAPNWDWFPIEIHGDIAPALQIGTVAGAFIKPNDNTFILRSTTSTPAINFQGGLSSSAISLRLDRLEVQSTGTATAINLTPISQATLTNMLVSTGVYSATITSWPIDHVGILMPGASNGGQNFIDNVAVCGFGNGIFMGEHFVGGHVLCYNNKKNLVATTCHHGGVIQRYQCGGGEVGLIAQDDPNGAGGSIAPIIIHLYDTEVGSTKTDIDNSNGKMRGRVTWGNTRPGYGYSETYFVAIGMSDDFHVNHLSDIPVAYNDKPRGTLLTGATRYFPTTSVDKWSDVSERDAWFSYANTAELGVGGVSKTLAPATDGWLAQQYRAATGRGSYVGFIDGSRRLGFAADATGLLHIYNTALSASPIATGVAMDDGLFYAIRVIDDIWGIVSTDDGGATWADVHAIADPWNNILPVGNIIPEMLQSFAIDSRFAGPVYYPQGSM